MPQVVLCPPRYLDLLSLELLPTSTEDLGHRIQTG